MLVVGASGWGSPKFAKKKHRQGHVDTVNLGGPLALLVWSQTSN